MINNVSYGNVFNPQQYPKDLKDVDFASANTPQLYANNTSFGSGLNSQEYSKDIENLVKYGTGAAIVEQAPGPFEGMGLMLGIAGAMEAFKGGKWLLNNKKDLSGGWATYTAGANAQIAGIKTAGGVTTKAGLKNIMNIHNAKVITDAVPTGDKFVKLTEAAKTSDRAAKALKNYEAAKIAAKYAAEHPENAKRAFTVANKRLANANALAHGEVGATGFFGKIGKFLGKYTGISKLNGAVKNLATKSPLTAKVLKFGKGNGIFLGITAAIEMFTQVIPTFAQLGFEKGLKQLGKSVVKTAANIGGWIAGSAVGTAGGAALGASIGVIGGPIGMAIGGALGGICGMIGGFIGSWAAGKAAEKLVGKNELDIAKEENAKTITEKVGQNPQAIQEVIATAEQRLQAEGNESEDAKIAFGSLSKLKQAIPAQAQTNTDAITNPSFQGQNQQFGYNQNSATTNPFASNPYAGGMNQPIINQNIMDKDFMALSCGLA